MMWFLQVIAVAIILALVFVGGMIQGESQEREHQRNKHRLERMGGTDGSNKYMRVK
ncbi:hypothetical protein QMA66_01365 [Leuconostoc suionicum]|uniref:hypothetical protein n=2 Tax=Leuconostoc TaxID=1243 RepID=UPI0024AD4C53|nr:hypothetical protein [Leuconostoc suionicum]MDI6497153.1 hypothetical protein [Leuconostoc suionicum]